MVTEDYAQNDQIVQKVCHVIGAFCQWKDWTDRRWITIGDTSRSFLGDLLLGIGDFIAFAIQHGTEGFLKRRPLLAMQCEILTSSASRH